MPIRYTNIIIPMKSTEPGFNQFRKYYNTIRNNLEISHYNDIDDFFEKNGIISDDYYHNIIRAGIHRLRVFLKRQPNEKWHNSYNPFTYI